MRGSSDDGLHVLPSHFARVFFFKILCAANDGARLVDYPVLISV